MAFMFIICETKTWFTLVSVHFRAPSVPFPRPSHFPKWMGSWARTLVPNGAGATATV